MRSKLFKQVFWLVLCTAIILVFYVTILAVSRSGKTKVVITVVPHDSKVLLNGREYTANVLYLKPGSYKFTAKRDGFADDGLAVNVSGKSTTVGLIPAPTSQAAEDFLAANPSAQLEREAIGGGRFATKSQRAKAKSPVIDLLPYTDINGPFTIDYGASPDRKEGVFLVVSDSSPNGRANALKWIKQQGFDPTNFEISFYDYANPLADTNSGGRE